MVVAARVPFAPRLPCSARRAKAHKADWREFAARYRTTRRSVGFADFRFSSLAIRAENIV